MVYYYDKRYNGLCNVCFSGDLNEFLLEEKKLNIENIHYEELRLLHIAAKNTNIEIFNYLLSKNLDINSINQYAETPLHIACLAGNLQVIKLLLSNEKINTSKVDNFNRTAFYNACIVNNLEIIKYLLIDSRINAYISDNNNKSPFHIACACNNIELVKYFLTNKNIDLHISDKYNNTPFSNACRNNNINIVKLFLSDKRFNLYKDLKHTNVFIDLCYYGYINILECILNEKIINLDFKNYNNSNGLMVAIDSNKIEVVKLILNDGRINPNEFNGYRTAFDMACEYKKFNIINLLMTDLRIKKLNNIKYDKNIQNIIKKYHSLKYKKFKNIYLLMACAEGNIEYIKNILKKR